MKITFLGAAHEVTGSCTYLEVGDKRGLVDYGMEQGRNLFENEPIPVPPEELDFVLLTHAHIDHAGLLPLLWKRGFRGYVYTSAATVQLCDIMLRDSANIQMQEAEWKSRKAQRAGEAAVEPLYDLDDVDGVMSHMIPCPYDKITQVNDCVSIRLTDVGHLLGSAAIEVWLHEGEATRKICFSGDIGNSDQPILRDPQFVKEADYLVIESTYGDRLHSHERVDYVSALAQRIQETLDRNGNVVIPSFAVGRTQEMLYFIREIKEKGLVTGHGDFPVYVDSPLAIEATNIFLQCDTSFLDEDMQALIRSGINPIFFPGLELAVSQADHPEVFGGIKSESEGIKMVQKTAGFLLKQGLPGAALLPRLIFQSGMKYLGYRLGKRYRSLPGPAVRRLTGNLSYWERVKQGDRENPGDQERNRISDRRQKGAGPGSFREYKDEPDPGKHRRRWGYTPQRCGQGQHSK